MTAPAISVLMAVHDGEPFLEQALESVFGQSFGDFELILIDDCSTDSSPRLLASAAARDSRVKLLTNAENLGLTKSLNLGLRQASGRYVARLDADDLCLPDRLAVQFRYMEDHPEYVAVACGYQVIDAEGRVRQTEAGGLDDWQVRWLGGFNPPAPHPAYFFRRLAQDGSPYLYDESFRTAQDFEFFSRLALDGKVAVLPRVLLKYRRHAGAITVAKRREQAANCARIGRENLRRRLPAEVFEKLEPLLRLFAYEVAADRAGIAAAVEGCDAMLAHDVKAAPTARHRRWLRRMTAGLLADAVLSRGGGLTRGSSLVAFVVEARAHLPALLAAVAAQPGLALKSLRNTGKF